MKDTLCVSIRIMGLVLVLVVTVAWLTSPTRADEQLAPAMFVFGDSLADVGNNNYLEFSLIKADFPHNGIDFPTHKPTGRFSNGKNAADFLAEKLGLPSAPPYLYLVKGKMNNFITGVNFASGGAGILNGTSQLFRQSISFSKQIEYYSAVRDEMAKQLGESGVQNLQAKAIHAIVIGSNDIFGYKNLSSSSSKQTAPQQYVSSMLTTIKSQLKRMYEIGGRKFAMIGVGAIGCCPSKRSGNSNGECNADENAMAYDYNQGLVSTLDGLKTELQGFQYSYFNTYDVFLNFIQNPAVYGFKEVKAACCGLGNLNAKVPCLPISTFCANRSDHVFWDYYHPTEAADRIFIDTAFDGPQQYTHPVNIRQLVAI